MVKDFGETFFKSFADKYAPVHYPLITVLTVSSVLLNLLNVVIFSRKHMRLPANTILASLAFSMALHALVTLVTANMERSVLSQSFIGATVIWALFNVNETIHNIVVFHSVFLAMARFLALRSPFKAAHYCTVRNIKRVLYGLYPVISFLSIPTFLAVRVCYKPPPVNTSGNATVGFCFNKWAWDIGILKYNFWFIGTVFKLLPCALILVLTSLLTCQLRKLQRRRRLLKGSRSRRWSTSAKTRGELRRGRRTSISRASNAIPINVAILVLILVETPQGVQNILAGIYGPEFNYQVTYNLMQFMAMITESSNLILFGVYCATNPPFRTTLARLMETVICQICLKNTNNVIPEEPKSSGGIELKVRSSESVKGRNSQVHQNCKKMTSNENNCKVYKKIELRVPLMKKQAEGSSSAEYGSSTRVVLRMTFESPRLYYKHSNI